MKDLPVRRYAELTDDGKYARFIMEIPTKGLTLNEETKKLYNEILSVDISSDECLIPMSKMVKIIRETE